jgi:trans-aconitate methyltransferase
VLDLACGTGAISMRVLGRFPDTRVVALNRSLAHGHRPEHTLADADGRFTWIKTDLRWANWTAALQDLAPFDAVLSSTALHWLTPGELVSVYRHVAAPVHPGGVLLTAEHLLVGPPAHQLGVPTETPRRGYVGPSRGLGQSSTAAPTGIASSAAISPGTHSDCTTSG